MEYELLIREAEVEDAQVCYALLDQIDKSLRLRVWMKMAFQSVSLKWKCLSTSRLSLITRLFCSLF